MSFSGVMMPGGENNTGFQFIIRENPEEFTEIGGVPGDATVYLAMSYVCVIHVM